MSSTAAVPATGSVTGPPVPADIERLTGRVVSSGTTTTITTPFTGAPLVELPVSGADDVATAYDTARAAQSDWASCHPHERATPFIRFHDAILDRRDEILDILQLETGKARRHAFEEVMDAAGCTLYYARRAPSLLRPRRRQGICPVATQTTELRQPKGVVGIISPWNYPMALGVVRRHPGAAGRQRASSTSPTPRRSLSRAVARRPADRVRPARATSGRSCPATPPRSATAIVDDADYVVVHRLHPWRPRDRREGRAPADRLLAGARRQEPDDRRWRTPTSTRPRAARSAPASPTPAALHLHRAALRPREVVDAGSPSGSPSAYAT